MEYRILGPLEVVDGGRTLGLGGVRQRALLAALVLRANQVVPSDVLLEEVWGDNPPASGVRVVQVYVSQLRKALGAQAIVTRDPGYVLVAEPDSVDLHRFERLVDEARQLDPAGAAGVLREALALWRGPPLADFAYDDFAQIEITRLQELRLAALEARVDADLALGRHPELAGELEALVAEHPLRERLRGQLMLALYRSGRQPEALAAYQAGSRALREELGIEPGRALQELERAILNQDSDLDVAVPAVRPEAPEPPAPVAREVRKTVTVLELSVVAIGDQDPESLRQVLDHAFVEVRAALTLRQAAVERVRTDGVTAVFGLPAVHEDDPLRAVRAAVDIRSRLQRIGDALETRICICTGEVIAGGDADRPPTGEALVAAGRLAQAAAPGDILLADSTRRVLRGDVEVEPSDGAWRVLGVAGGPPGPARRFEARLVGRRRERRRLEDAFEQAVGDDSCQLFTILGAAGVGKSRLVAEFLGRLDGSTRVARGRCLPYGDGITYWPLLEAVRELAGADPGDSLERSRERVGALLEGDEDADMTAVRVAELLGLAEGGGGVQEGFRAVRNLLEAVAKRSPVVVVFDDVHWGEQNFLDLVEHVADWSRDAPLLLVCVARPELLDVRPGWGGGKLNATTLLLEPLSEAESEELLDNLASTTLGPDTRRQIVEAAEGNPLFVEEMVALVSESGGAVEVPPTIQALLAARLDQLGPEDRTVLEAASVEGKEFHEGSVAQLVPGDVAPEVGERLNALRRKELIRPGRPMFPGESAYRFRHLLIRDATYEAMPKRARAYQHERHADWLLAKTGDRSSEYDEILGYHLEQAFRYRSELGILDDLSAALAARAAGHLGAAGRRAFTTSDVPAALKLISRAVALLPPGDPLRVDLVPSVRIAQGISADLNWADTILREAITSGDQRVRTHAIVQRALLRLFITEPGVSVAELLEAGEEAIRVFTELDDDLGLARAWRLVAQGHYLARRAGPSAMASLQALVHAHRIGDSFEQREVVDWLAVAYVLGPAPAAEASRVCERVLHEVAGDPVAEATLLSTLAELNGMQGDEGAAEELAARCRHILDDLGQPVWLTAVWFGYLAMIRDDYAAIEIEVRPAYEALRAASRTGQFSSLAIVLAQAAYAQGRYDEAKQFTREAEEVSRANDVQCQTIWRSTRAKALARQGQLDTAEALGREAVAFAAESDFHPVHAEALVDLAEVLRIAGRADEASPLVRHAITLHERKGNVISAAKARDLLAKLSP
jgi:DNA-binding SARP family transcriptional activator/tetratricopeptide (TPR) repeat protein